jgi:hypothetical protein
MREFIIDDSKSANNIKESLANFQKELFKDLRVLGEQVATSEADYIKTTIENTHRMKYNVFVKKEKDGWIIFPDRFDVATQEEFGLSFPIWRKLYQDYKVAERK